MSRIAIDCRFAALPVGLGRYTREIVPHLVDLLTEHEIFLFVRASDESWITLHLREHVTIVPAPFPHYSFAEQWTLPGLLSERDIDLLWSPHFTVPFFCPVPFVATVHDLILHRYPNRSSPLSQAAYRILLSRTVRKAKTIIVPSVFVSEELADVYDGQVAFKTTVIPEGVSPLFHPRSLDECAAVLQRHQISTPFFLYVGNAKQHKNLHLLLNAFREVADPQTHLVLVTGGKESASLELSTSITRIDAVTDEELACLYSSATAFISPSLYEGFGLPVAEAESCGCPVIAVRSSAVGEVASDRASLIPATHPAMVTALRNPPAKYGPIPHRNWSEVARDTAKVLRDALQ